MTNVPELLRQVRWAAGSVARPNLEEVAAIHAAVSPQGSGVMVDVGAHFGGSLLRFAADGWEVHAFEPDPSNRDVLVRRVHEMPNVRVDPRAIGEADNVEVPLFTSPISSGISTLHPFHPSHEPTARVSTVRLDTYLRDCDEVTFLKVDAEGHDLQVLRTFPWDRVHPRAILCEFEARKTLRLGYSMDDLASYLQGLGYSVLVSEWLPVRRYGARHRWRSLRLYPCSLRDPAAWGNLIAVEPSLIDAVRRQAKWGARGTVLLRKLWSRLRRSVRRG